MLAESGIKTKGRAMRVGLALVRPSHSLCQQVREVGIRALNFVAVLAFVFTPDIVWHRHSHSMAVQRFARSRRLANCIGP